MVSDDADVEDDLLLAFRMLRSSGTTRCLAAAAGGAAMLLVGKLGKHVVAVAELQMTFPMSVAICKLGEQIQQTIGKEGKLEVSRGTIRSQRRLPAAGTSSGA
jgi:hypothetical protein